MAKVEIEVKAVVDEANRQLKALDNEIADIEASSHSTSLSMTDLNQALEVAEKVIGYVKQAYAATVKVFLDYADTVRDVTTATGVSANEASRLIESSDDMGVSVGALKLAMRTMLKDGLQPTVENFAKLADEYNAIQDPAQRAQFAMDKFGRSGLEMTKWLEGGSAAMREASGIMDDQMAASAHEAELAFDALQDAGRNIALSLGADLVPSLTKLAQGLELAVTWQARLNKEMDEAIDPAKLADLTYAEYAKTLKDAATKAGYLVDENGNLVKSAGSLGSVIVKTNYLLTEQQRALAAIAAADQKRALAVQAALPIVDESQKQQIAGIAALREEEAAIDKADESYREYVQSIGAAGDASEMMRLKQMQANVAIVQNTIDTQALAAAQAALAVGLAGPVGNEIDNYNTKQGEITTRIVDIQSRIDVLNSKSWLTAAQKTELENLKTALSEQQLAAKATADAHELATKRIVFGFLEQQVAADTTLTALQKTDILAQTANSLGLLDDASLRMYKTVTQIYADYAKNPDVELMDKRLIAAAKGFDYIGQSAFVSATKINTSLNTVTTGPEGPAFTAQMLAHQAELTGVGAAAVAAEPVVVTSFTNMEREAGKATVSIQGVQNALNNLQDKTVTITTRYLHEEGIAGGGGGRAAGGPVSAGVPYLVGERGPEMFVPQQSGTIVPNRTNNYNLTVNTLTAPQIPAEFGRAQAWAGAM